MLADPHRQLVMPGLEAPGAGHAAARRLQLLDADAHPLEQLLLALDPAGGAMVTVAVQDRRPMELRRLPLSPVLLEELAEVERLLAQPAPVLVAGAQLRQPVLDDGDPGRL